ncbi:MAG: hypothetical protein ACTSR8_14145 [Promethearchaeota archaeon]
MDSGLDFLRPEFLNILFFEQKNLVIFPYVDLKHLRLLEIFSIGHNVIDLESTALYNLKEIIELESSNYSQNPSIYFIYNLDKNRLKEVMNIKGVRCILNINEDVSRLANGSNFIFYNKKAKKFLNYKAEDKDLEFEKYLISTSDNENILMDKIQELKMIGNLIFSAINRGENLSKYLDKYNPNYWNKILNYVSQYNQINIPERYLSDLKIQKKKTTKAKSIQQKSFSEEYEIIVTTNSIIGKEFIQLLHQFGQKLIDNAVLSKLFNPSKLYDHLRNTIWTEGLPKDFLSSWVQFKSTGFKHTDQIREDFKYIFKKLKIPITKFQTSLLPSISTDKKESIIELKNKIIPNVKDFAKFKAWVFTTIQSIEKKLEALQK